MPPEFRSAAAWRENWKVYVETVRYCCDLCEQAGVRYALEPHPFRWVTDAASMLRLIEHIQSPALGINYDPIHTFPSGDLPHVAVYMLGDRIFHCHLSDNDAASHDPYNLAEVVLNVTPGGSDGLVVDLRIVKNRIAGVGDWFCSSWDIDCTPCRTVQERRTLTKIQGGFLSLPSGQYILLLLAWLPLRLKNDYDQELRSCAGSPQLVGGGTPLNHNKLGTPHSTA